MQETDILIKQRTPLLKINIIVEPSNRKIDPYIEKLAEEYWQKTYNEAKKQGRKIYDAISYRLNGFETSNNQIIIRIAEISYRKRYSLRFIKELSNFSEDYYPRGLYIAAIFKTKDNKYIVGENSGLTMATSKITLIGGLLSKPEVEIKNSNSLKQQLEKEILEETGIPAKHLQKFTFIGMAKTKKKTVGIFVEVNTDLTTKQVNQLFHESSDKELEKLLFLTKKEFREAFYRDDTLTDAVVKNLL